jgi:outer membrane protein OmpA-like peptidoglycan-associated protein
MNTTQLGIVSSFLMAVLPSIAMADFTDNAPNYVDLVPIQQLITSAPQACGAQETLQVPMIDWSGDFVTVYANGGVQTDTNSIFALFEQDVNLYVQNDLIAQANDFLSCASPLMRVTQDQAMLLAPVMEAQDETNMVALYKHSFSNGDHLVTRGLDDVSTLCSANIAIMRYGPHTGFMGRILSDAGCDLSSMQSNGQIHWTSNLSGEDSPYHAMVSDPEIDAAFVVTPDMIAMVENGDVPDSSVMVSTKTLSRIISDVYVVRRDFLLANQDRMQDFVHALFLGGEEFQGLMAGMAQGLAQNPPSLTVDQQFSLDMMANTFDSVPDAVEAGFFWLDADFSGYPGNVNWAIETNPRGWLGLNNELQTNLAAIGLSNRVHTLAHAAWDYEAMTEGLQNTNVTEQPVFDASAVAALVKQQQRTGTLESGELFSFEIFFGPRQTDFPSSQYEEDFKKLIDFSLAYGGAVITVEGHADPLGYLRAQDPARFGNNAEPAGRLALRQQAQGLYNLSADRANAARNSLLTYGQDALSIILDPSQFNILPRGIEAPRSGMCGGLPCAPANEQEWRENMRVEFRIIAVDTESDVFVAASQ